MPDLDPPRTRRGSTPADPYCTRGNDKLAVLLRREGIGLSSSMVGRILGRVRGTGDLVQLDTPDVRPLPALVLKQYTARDVVSRWHALQLRSTASARSVGAIPDAPAALTPFSVRALSVADGSKFMAEFEAACAERGIALFTLPPRSPKLSGKVEQANRIHTQVFYEVTERPGDPLQTRVPRSLPGRLRTTPAGSTKPGLSDTGRVPRLRGIRGVADVPASIMSSHEHPDVRNMTT